METGNIHGNPLLTTSYLNNQLITLLLNSTGFVGE